MKRLPVLPRRQANDDIAAAINYYVSQESQATALAFVDAIESAFARLSLHPAIGSPSYAHELNLPGHRCWQLPSLPYPVFNVAPPNHIDVWRVLHASARRARLAAVQAPAEDPRMNEGGGSAMGCRPPQACPATP